MNHLTFDKSSVFEYLVVAAEEPSNREALRESYWIIVYIYLKKIGWDIVESISTDKTNQMLKGVNPHDFTFNDGYLLHETSQKQIDLNIFVPVAIEEALSKKEYGLVNNMHNLTKVHRIKSEHGLLSDYPHFYHLKLEGKEEVRLYAVRNSENGEFIISS